MRGQERAGSCSVKCHKRACAQKCKQLSACDTEELGPGLPCPARHSGSSRDRGCLVPKLRRSPENGRAGLACRACDRGDPESPCLASAPNSSPASVNLTPRAGRDAYSCVPRRTELRDTRGPTLTAAPRGRQVRPSSQGLLGQQSVNAPTSFGWRLRLSVAGTDGAAQGARGPWGTATEGDWQGGSPLPWASAGGAPGPARPVGGRVTLPL